MDINIIWKGPAALGEGPMWHVQQQKLYWIDIAKPTLHELDPNNNEHRSWKMPDIIGAIAPRANGGLVASMGDSVVGIDLPSGEITPIVKVISGRGDLRLNDGKCDRLGRYWIGVANLDVKHPKGGLFRLNPDGQLTQMESGITISNGLGWSPDNKTFYYTNGLEYIIYQYDFDLETGEISNRRTFVKLEKSEVEPDGLTVDSEGFVWAAQYNGGKIVRYSPNGTIDREIIIPVKRPTSCIFGGANLDRLYVTSCSRDITETTTLPPPAGALFAIDVGIKGLPEPVFQG